MGFPPAAPDVLGQATLAALGVLGVAVSLALPRGTFPGVTATMSQRWPNSPRPRGSAVSPWLPTSGLNEGSD